MVIYVLKYYPLMDYVNFKQNEDFQVLLTLEEIIPLTLLGKEKKSKSLKKKSF